MELSIKKIIFGILIGVSKLYSYYLIVLNIINFNDILIYKKIITILLLIVIIFYEILITQNPIKTYKKKVFN